MPQYWPRGPNWQGPLRGMDPPPLQTSLQGASDVPVHEGAGMLLFLGNLAPRPR
jgi:hypothetical protein